MEKGECINESKEQTKFQPGDYIRLQSDYERVGEVRERVDDQLLVKWPDKDRLIRHNPEYVDLVPPEEMERCLTHVEATEDQVHSAGTVRRRA